MKAMFGELILEHESVCNNFFSFLVDSLSPSMQVEDIYDQHVSLCCGRVLARFYYCATSFLWPKVQHLALMVLRQMLSLAKGDTVGVFIEVFGELQPLA